MDEQGGHAERWLRHALGLKGDDAPFPWQLDLLDDFRNGRLWPALDIPTGLGKTSVMAIWLVARALGANLPRRLVYVVDRRAVVDQASEVATHLRDFVEKSPEIKKRLGLEKRLLPVSTLRGKFVDNREWLEDPTAPALIVGTIDMIGSRLLFQGYGVSPKMRPYQAGLLGVDSLTVVDEAHLVPAFEGLLRDVERNRDLYGIQDKALRALVPSFKLTSLSATGRGAREQAVFRLSEKDFKHEVLNKRLTAPKRMRIRKLVGDDELATRLAAEAWELARKGNPPVRCIVFCDRREDALRVKEEIARHARENREEPGAVDVEIELFVGGRRVLERELAAVQLQNLGLLADSPSNLNRLVFLVATSAAEVGVDLDADCMVCDLVPWERMVQRLGRVNRRGEVPGGADVVVIVPEPKAKKSKARKQNPEQRNNAKNGATDEGRDALARHRAFAAAVQLLPCEEEVIDASVDAIRRLNAAAEKDPSLQRILQDAMTPAPLRPALTHALVEAWSMTSLDYHTGRPEIGPWLRGWVKDPPQTQIVWRNHLPVHTDTQRTKAVTKKDVETFFEVAPPHLSEVLETETYQVAKWLTARAKSILRKGPERQNGQVPLPRAEDIVAFVLTGTGKLKRPLQLRELTTGESDLKESLSGTTIVVDVRLAGLRYGLLDSNEADPPAAADGVQTWEPPVGFRIRNADADKSPSRDPGWRERFRFPVELSSKGDPIRWLIIEKYRVQSANEEDRSAGVPQLLEEHRLWAEDCARVLAGELALPREYEEMLCASAFLHDEGKRSRRWQRAFNSPEGNEIWAKTDGPINYDLLDGYRHELGSLLAIKNHDRFSALAKNLRDLSLHLVAAHHGFGRPVIRTQACDAAPPSLLEEEAEGVALRFARLLQIWGPWGLAWWESLLRAADQQASRKNDAREKQSAATVHSGVL